ncbi:hypothetical protein [Chitinophaga varians]|uniref:hypothetical protein n=1 Tax=Chitinophaga varians TaxID=2202339 RepID=UPI00165EDF22|nr:hypothetical protein [Chitinophaga varians]MBC9915015.1 hypothetical protein [Chitinophaga varians]
MFKLTCKIRIGQHFFTDVNEVKVKRSIYSFVDTATIRIPTSAVLYKTGELTTASILEPGDNTRSGKSAFSEEVMERAARRVAEKTGSFFKVGDAVEIWLGYDDENELEFEGFVSRIDFTTPCVIECEGYSWQLRNKVITQEFPALKKLQEYREKDPTYENPPKTTVKDVLNFIRQGTDIVLSDKIPNIPLVKMSFNGETGLEALEKLKREAFVTIYFNGPELYAGLKDLQPGKQAVRNENRKWTGKRFEPLKYKEIKDPVRYGIGLNLVSSEQLRYRKAIDAPLKVRVIHFTNRNVAEEVTVGERGDIRTFYVPDVDPDKELKGPKGSKELKGLKEVALKRLKELSYDGYDGKVTAFLQPFSAPGFAVSLRDRNYNDRDGVYVLDSTEVTFGTGGARRVCGIGDKISKKDEQTTGTTGTGAKKA